MKMKDTHTHIFVVVVKLSVFSGVSWLININQSRVVKQHKQTLTHKQNVQFILESVHTHKHTHTKCISFPQFTQKTPKLIGSQIMIMFFHSHSFDIYIELSCIFNTTSSHLLHNTSTNNKQQQQQITFIRPFSKQFDDGSILSSNNNR